MLLLSDQTELVQRAMLLLTQYENLIRVQLDCKPIKSSATILEYSGHSDEDDDDNYGVTSLPFASAASVFPPLDFESQRKIDEVKTFQEEISCKLYNNYILYILFYFSNSFQNYLHENTGTS